MDNEKGLYTYFRHHYQEWFPTLRRIHRTTFARQTADLWAVKEELRRDLLVSEEDEDPPDGTMVVALLNGGEEVTVKRICRNGQTVKLKSENGEHEEITIAAEEVKIQGGVLLVLHPPRN